MENKPVEGRNPLNIWTTADLASVYREMTSSVRFHCRFVTAVVGGVGASDEELRAFVKHHLKLTGEPAEQAFLRIKTFELGQRDVTPEAGELNEEEVYSVKTFRKGVSFEDCDQASEESSVRGAPWLGDWMQKANIKAAASRCGLFTEKRGSKGDIAEGGCVRSVGISLRNPAYPERIYVRAPGNTGPAPTHFEKFMGRVSSPSGSVSIMHHSEVIDAGAEFECELRFLPGRISTAKLKEIFALMGNIGLGSVKAMERGKFEIISAEVHNSKGDTTPTSPGKGKNSKTSQTATPTAGLTIVNA